MTAARERKGVGGAKTGRPRVLRPPGPSSVKNSNDVGTKLRLTKRAVDAARPDRDRDVFLWDDELPGFGLRVYPSGRKVWVVQYRTGGRKSPQRRLKLGLYGPLTPDQARTLALRALHQVAQGADPHGQKIEAREAARLTVQRVFDEWIADSEGKRRASTIDLYRDLFTRLILPELGQKPVSTLTQADVAAWHRKQKAAPYQGNRALAALAALITWATGQGYRMAAAGNPCAGIARFQEEKRERFLNEAELASVGEAIAAAEAEGMNAAHAAALRLLILTGARRDEIRTLRWEHVDTERAMLRLPRSKTGKKVVHLPPPALLLLAAQKRIDGNPFVFPGTKRGEPVSELNRAWYAVRDRAGLAGVRLHDLRHTHASLGAAAGLSLPVIGKLLGHTQPSTTARYAHLADDPVKRAAEMIGNVAARALGIATPGDPPGGQTGAVVPVSATRSVKR
ncbi:tyrosine-type recombinase/integrase [Elioraea sp.]|uniref:tyrosine-type recombinase/integrase n=1 Tax=Elioraea sp. TaxID=2185103 RepID=UPI003F6F5BBA